MQYLDNFKLSTRDREKYKGRENLKVFKVAAKSEIEEILDGFTAKASRSDQPTPLIFSSFLVEFY